MARIYAPGCKADHIPILEGDEDIFKSSLLGRLFTPWFSDDIADLGTKDAQMQMNGVWCLDIAELASMRRADIEKVNAFASRRYRPSYGRHVVQAPRQCVVIGTTNSDQYLKDDTGARRFRPLRCGRIDLDSVTRDRDQLWAEAVALYRDGVPWWLTDAAEGAAARHEQGAATPSTLGLTTSKRTKPTSMRRWSDGGEEIDEQLVFRVAAYAVKHRDPTLITE